MAKKITVKNEIDFSTNNLKKRKLENKIKIITNSKTKPINTTA